MITLQGAITLRSPLHTSAGYQGLRLTADGKVTSNDKDGIAVVSTLTTPLTVAGRFYGHMPIYPSSSIIGALRRHASARMRSALLQDGKKITAATCYALNQGQPAATQLGSTVTLEQFNATRNHFFFGLFGGATLRNASQFNQHELIPILDATLEASMVPQRFADLAPAGATAIEPRQLLAYRVMRKIDDLRRGRDVLSASDVDLQELDADTKVEAAAAYQIVSPGTSFFYRLQLKDSTSPEQRGLLLLALCDWIKHGQIGGREHLGWGCFSAHRFRYIDGQDRHDLFDMGEDDDGLLQLNTTSAFKSLTAPAVQQLTEYSNSPATERKKLLELLQG